MKLGKLLLLFLPLCSLNQSFAQTSVRGRASLEADWKVAKGLHIGAEYELRSAESFAAVERHQFTLGTSYKINNYLKVGAGYCYVARYNTSRDFKPSHRAHIDLTASTRGPWKLSLRERLILAHKSYSVNSFQEAKNDVVLKSRLKLSYTGFKSIEPYAFFELKNIFNAVSCDFNYDGTSYSGYNFKGYDDAYVTRLRGALGLEWKLSRHSAIDFSCFVDYNRDRKIDTNKAGTKLKDISWEKAWCTSLCLGYCFSF